MNGLDFYERLPNDLGKGKLPTPPTEKAKKAIQYLKDNALPLAGLCLAVIL